MIVRWWLNGLKVLAIDGDDVAVLDDYADVLGLCTTQSVMWKPNVDETECCGSSSGTLVAMTTAATAATATTMMVVALVVLAHTDIMFAIMPRHLQTWE